MIIDVRINNMKKKKVVLKYDMIDGSCVGHYNDRSNECVSCKYSNVCCKINEKDVSNFFPKSEQDVIEFVAKYENK